MQRLMLVLGVALLFSASFSLAENSPAKTPAVSETNRAKNRGPDPQTARLVDQIQELMTKKEPFLVVFFESTRKDDQSVVRRNKRLGAVNEYERLKTGIPTIIVDLALPEAEFCIYKPFLGNEADDYRTMVDKGGVLLVGWDGKDAWHPHPLVDGIYRLLQIDLYVRSMPNLDQRFPKLDWTTPAKLMPPAAEPKKEK